MKPTKGLRNSNESNALSGRKGGVTFPKGRGASDILHDQGGRVLADKHRKRGVGD